MKCKYHFCDKEIDKEASKLLAKKPRIFCCTLCKTKYHVDKNRKNRKIQSILYLGGKCQKCGYNKCPTALDFHHKDPSTKEFCLSTQPHTRSWERTKKELDKCELLCATCHREKEFELIKKNWLHIESYIEFVKNN